MRIEDEAVNGFLSGWGLTAKPCDSCKSAAALLFCRADSAFLCVGCDSKIHAVNRLASRHERVWMCEVCEQAPASVTCKADAATLCVTCDRDIHSANPLARRHERVPVIPFFDSAEAVAKSTTSLTSFLDSDDVLKPEAVDDAATAARDDAEAWLLPNPSSKVAADFLFSDLDPLLDFNYKSPNLDFKIQELPHASLSAAATADCVVPTHPKSNLNYSVNHPSKENCLEIGFTRSKLSPFNYPTQCVSHSLSSSDVGVVPDGNSNSISEVSYPFSKAVSSGLEGSSGETGSTIQAAAVAAQPLSRMDREARVLRYREKRKNRKFEKTIRYASRKAYAESRPRIKGRFAKRREMENDADEIFGSGGSGRAFMVDQYGGFGIVPSF
ncbi:hypothetical protein Ancab_027728 [Ancistrocladus abbreviatus]